MDLELKVPHNTGERLERIARHDPVIPEPSNTKISVRVDHKNYDKKISKPIAKKFVDDIDKNPNVAEHWLTGGGGLTKGAKDELNSAPAPTRYFSQDDIDTISSYYNESDNDVESES